MFSLDPDFLRTFIAISETGSFGAAGERVNKTQSTVSAQMKRLEEILDVSLFEKEGRRNVLTADGRKFLEYAASMVRLNDEALNAFRPPEIRGSIRVGAIDEYAQQFFPDVLIGFARAHPCVQVEVTTGTTPRLRELLDADALDAAVVSSQGNEADFELLRSDRLHWIGAEGACGHFDDPLPHAAWSDGCSWRQMALAALARGGRTVRLSISTSNAGLLSTAVRNGLGVAVVPRWFLSPGLRIIEDLDARYPLGTAEVGIKRRPGTESGALDAFLCHLRTNIGNSALAA